MPPTVAASVASRHTRWSQSQVGNLRYELTVFCGTEGYHALDLGKAQDVENSLMSSDICP